MPTPVGCTGSVPLVIPIPSPARNAQKQICHAAGFRTPWSPPDRRKSHGHHLGSPGTHPTTGLLARIRWLTWNSTAQGGNGADAGVGAGASLNRAAPGCLTKGTFWPGSKRPCNAPKHRRELQKWQQSGSKQLFPILVPKADSAGNHRFH